MKSQKLKLSIAVVAVACLIPGIALAQPPDLPPQANVPVQEPPVPSGIIPENPRFNHPAAAAEHIPSGVAAVVNMRDIPADPPGLVDNGRTIIQGEFIQHGGIDLQFEQPGARERTPPMTPVEDEEYLFKTSSSLSFDGIANTGWNPPDTVMAVGPSHIMEVANSHYAIYNKSGGTVVGQTSLASFFAPVQPNPWNGFYFDPRLLYDIWSNKYVMLVLGRDDTNQNSYFFIGISQTSNAAGTWWIWRFQADTGTNSDAWLDFAGVGADLWGVYVTGNYFRWTGGFKWAMVQSLNPAMLTGGASNGWRFWDLKTSGTTSFSLQPALPHSGAGDQATFFVNSLSSSGNRLHLWKLTGDRTNSPTLTSSNISVPAYDAIYQNVDQTGTAINLDGGDCRVGNAVYIQRRVFTALTDDVNSNSNASGWLTVKLNVDSNSTEWSHLLWSGDNTYLTYPAVTVEGSASNNPKIAVFGSYSTSTSYGSSIYKIYSAPPASTGTYSISRNGVGTHTSNRWGDYSGAGYDWYATANGACGAAEWADSSNRWSTRIRCRSF